MIEDGVIVLGTFGVYLIVLVSLYAVVEVALAIAGWFRR